MKSIKQIEQDPRVSEVERNPCYDPEDVISYPDYHDPKYFLWLKDGYVFVDGSHVSGADTVKELNELLNEVEEDESDA